MAKADALSQREDHAIGIEEDNKGILLSHRNRSVQCRLGSSMRETAVRTRFENTPRHMTWQKATKITMKKMGFYPGMEKYLYRMMITCRWR